VFRFFGNIDVLLIAGAKAVFCTLFSASLEE
jgi:hypothetical protein